jgi:uncharacterized protein
MTVALLTCLILAISTLYAAVGQAGGSGYLAAMALLGVAPTVMRPTALVLNVLVASISTVKFYQAGYFSWSAFWPFAVTSIPAAFIGGSLSLQPGTYNVVVGSVLLYAAYRLFRIAQVTTTIRSTAPPFWMALLLGVGVGLLSGLTGIGGGILFGAALLGFGWADTRPALGMSAAINLSNSAAGLLGHVASVKALPSAIPIWAAAAILGGWIGADYGSRWLSPQTLQRLLAVALTIAGLKLLWP